MQCSAVWRGRVKAFRPSHLGRSLQVSLWLGLGLGLGSGLGLRCMWHNVPWPSFSCGISGPWLILFQGLRSMLLDIIGGRLGLQLGLRLGLGVRLRSGEFKCPIWGSNSVTVFVTDRRHRQTNAPEACDHRRCRICHSLAVAVQ